ncbi:MAG: fused MFS/spermidine synthase [bacterium]|nr:fused MFS/spermidine synthase [bacterium]
MEHRPSRVNPRYVLTAFLTGAAVMIAEIAAARAIAPHFGTSIIVWTNVIGIILVALSIGYWIGGRLSERCVPTPTRSPSQREGEKEKDFPTSRREGGCGGEGERVLGAIILAAGALLIIPAFAVPVIAGSMIGNLFRFGSGFLVLFIGSFFSVVILFALPIFLLGMVSPFLVKLATIGRSDAGAIAGKLYAISTIGSLVGTFLPTLVLLPTIGTRWSILSAAAVLIALGVALIARRRVAAMAGVVVFVFALVPDHAPSWLLGGTVVAAAESRYQYLRIVDVEPSNSSIPSKDAWESEAPRRDRFLVFNEGLGVQSVAVDPHYWPGGYFSAIAALPELIFLQGEPLRDPGLVGAKVGQSPSSFAGRDERDPVRVLILGNAGGTIGNLMQRFFPRRSFAITGVEIDPAVTAITAAHFPPPPHPYSIVHADSRAFVRQSNEQYDIVVVDAYTNQLTIPPHLASVEFFQLLKQRISPTGMVVANVNAPHAESPLFRTIAQTMADVFPHVEEGHSGAWNRIIIAGLGPFDFERLRSALPPRGQRASIIDLEELLYSLRSVTRDPALRIFTDDWAPLELMTDFEIFEALRSRRNNL